MEVDYELLRYASGYLLHIFKLSVSNLRRDSHVTFITYVIGSLTISLVSQQFQRHIKKSEGQKIPKVELQISIYGVKILDPKTKVSGDTSPGYQAGACE